jgi:chromate reductase, NAD(P)H dehydrogenase (quinone)
MKIIAISGSLRRASLNTALLRALPALAPAGMEFDLATLHGIPVYDGDDEAASGKPPAVLALDARIRAADGVIIATPEYNFSIPGGLKNATDWLSRGSNPLARKPVGIMGAAAGPLGTGRSQYHLRQNLQGLDTFAMPKPEVFVGLAQSKFNEAGDLTDEATRQVLSRWLTAFEAWVAGPR